MAYMLVEALKGRKIPVLKYLYDKAAQFQLPKFKSRTEFEEMLESCVDPDELFLSQTSYNRA